MENENKNPNMDFKERRLELASKFMKMGRSLIEEGEETGFENARHAGANLVLLSGLMLNDEDMAMFQYVSSMFSSKQILDNMRESPLAGMMMMESMAKAGSPDRIDMLDKLMDKMKGRLEEDSDDEKTED